MRCTNVVAVLAGALLLLLVAAPSAVMGGAIETAITRAADRLDASQAVNGSWTGETYFTGSIVAGLVNAYQVLGTASYKTAAEDGGTWILTNSSPNFLGDEAYSLTRLSGISADPSVNAWRTAASGFYTAVSTGGTSGYVSAYTGTNPSNAVFYLANHVVAATYVGAADQSIWRQGLIDFLSDVTDDTADYPVMALGIATWALAQSGSMDSTKINPAAGSGTYWYNKTLADLPGLLAGHQVTSGDNADSFFWRFDHTAPGGGDPSGFTEDTVFGTLGLIAANDANPALAFDDEILAARLVLASGVAGDGKMYEHIWSGGADYHTYAGETLQALPEPASLAFLATGGMLLLARRRRK